jgi:molybdopterin-containing oxidoreductase family iron-sulfur binding subunit
MSAEVKAAPAGQCADASSGWRPLAGDGANASLLPLGERRSAVLEPPAEAGRRAFLQLMGASAALSGLGGCLQRPTQTIVPYAEAPEKLIPGKPLFYASAVTLGGYATGVLVESHEGRPTKIEGSPDHPASLGATDVYAQAEVLGLYDPDRSQALLCEGQPATWNQFREVLNRELDRLRSVEGRGLYILTESITSPLLGQQLQQLRAVLPLARWHQYEPLHRDSLRAGMQRAFGAPVEPRPHLDAAQVVVAVDADFLGRGPGFVRHARDFIAGRRVVAGAAGMNRLYVVESALSVTGSNADHRLALRPREIGAFVQALAEAVVNPPAAPAQTPLQRFIAALAADLRAHRGAGLVLVGDQQPPEVHAQACVINDALGNVGRTVDYIASPLVDPSDHTESLRTLAQELAAGRVATLLVLGGNPAYYAPADLDLAQQLQKAPLRIHLGLYRDETAQLCHWHIPQAHTLEAWGDARAFDGTVSLIQPLIAPMYDGRTPSELLALLLGQPDRSAHDLLADSWRDRWPAAEFAQRWAQALQRGVVEGTAFPPLAVQLQRDAIAAPASAPTAAAPTQELDVLFAADPAAWDGRYANNAWLQELPRPLSTLTWDNAAQLSPATASRLGVGSGDVIEVTLGGRSLRAPVLVSPGHADGTLLLTLGHGRTAAGRVGQGVGYNAYLLRSTTAPWCAGGATVRKTGQRHLLAQTQRHHSMEGRAPIRSGTLAAYAADPRFVHADPEAEHPPSLFPAQPATATGHRWAMAIDLTACIGCGICVLACQAENNIPVVGRAQVLAQRAMHWLRVDHYYRDSDDPSQPEVAHQPVPCMHCENAPCELVCPTAATVHDHEGLNDMVYNRCVGTRYCSNNCPYKVRRFNFFAYSTPRAPSLRLVHNPDVTVRSRGVMEKCTYCVQRINAARLHAETEDRPLRDGEVVPACAQACPTRAIVFGDLSDAGSQVRRIKEHPLDYALLAELNTRPRTSYQARLRNPNPELSAPAAPARREG